MAGKLKTMERDFWFDLDPDNDGNINAVRYIDLAQCASLVNRVALRQGMEYVVESVEIFTTGAVNAMIFRLPEHWACINAWEKAFHMWNRQQLDNAEESGMLSTKARYRDFKVFFDAAHVTDGVGNNLIPIGYNIASAASSTESYEWNPSQFVLPSHDVNPGTGVADDAVEVYGHMLDGDNGATPLTSTSCGIIHAYGESRSRVHSQDPNIVDVPADDTLFGAMADVGFIQDDIITNFQEHNHVPPYLIDNDSSVEFYPGGNNQGIWNLVGSYKGQLEDIISVRAGSSSVSSDTIPGFVAPLGLLKVAYEAAATPPVLPAVAGTPPQLIMRVTLAPGGYKGLLAQSMQEAN